MHKIDLTTTDTATPVATSPVSPVVGQNPPVDRTAPIADNQTSAPLVRPLTTQKSMAKTSNIGFIIAALVAIVAGVGTGYGSFKLYAKTAGVPTETIDQVATTGSIKAGDTFGSTNTESFQDDASGYLEAGGLEGEGTHKLLRPGGPAQTVYLTSSVTDLSKLEGMEVKVWGETFKGQKAGWLMDVGRIEVINVQAEKPTE